MAVKTYVLLDELSPTAPIFQRINGDQRQRVTKLPVYGIPLRVAFTDKDGVYKVHRYKAQATMVEQDKQIEELKIPANERFTTQERRDTEFRNNVLVTTKVNLQKYLESLPYMEGVEGTVDGEKTPVYRLVDKEKDVKQRTSSFKLRLKVGQMIADLDLKSAQELLIRLNGSHFITPDNIDDCQELLIEYLDAAETEDDLQHMMKKDINPDEKATILIGNAINKKVLSFDPLSGEIKKMKGNKSSVVRTIKADDIHEQQRLFAEYITSDAGAALYQDIEKELSK